LPIALDADPPVRDILARVMRWRATAIAIPLLLGAAADARAEPTDADVSARIAWIERVLEREQAHARLWRDGWITAFTGVTLAQLGILGMVDDGPARLLAGIGAAKSTIAFSFLLVSPMAARSGAATLRAAPDRTPAERRAKLRLAESLLGTIAKEERFNRSWFPLAGGALVNTAGAWIFWAKYRRPVDGWVGVGVGVGVSQLQYHTQPTLAIRAWDAYVRAGPEGPGPRAVAPAPAPGVAIVPAPGGLAIEGSF
jgi:hypothetical protein